MGEVIKIEYKRAGYNMILFPVRNFEKAKHIQNAISEGVWAFTKDARPHKAGGKSIPAIVLPELVVDAFHLTSGVLSAAGYKPHWMVFEDRETGKITFGNKRSFLNGDAACIAKAMKMQEINLADFIASETINI